MVVNLTVGADTPQGFVAFIGFNVHGLNGEGNPLAVP
jgi:hypothetical protein